MSAERCMNTETTSSVRFTMKKKETPKKTPDIEKLPPPIRRFLEAHPDAYLIEDDAAFVLPQGSPRPRKTEDSEPDDDE